MLVIWFISYKKPWKKGRHKSIIGYVRFIWDRVYVICLPNTFQIGIKMNMRVSKKYNLFIFSQQCYCYVLIFHILDGGTTSYHCVKSLRIRSFSGPHFPGFGLNTERYFVSLRIPSQCEKMRTGITPNTDTF